MDRFFERLKKFVAARKTYFKRMFQLLIGIGLVLLSGYQILLTTLQGELRFTLAGVFLVTVYSGSAISFSKIHSILLVTDS